MKSESREQSRPPIVLLGIVLIAVRGISVFLGQVTGSETPPLSQLLLTQFYFAGEAALLVGLLLFVWKVVPWSRVVINLIAALVIPTLIFVGMIDLFLFLITGDHLTPSVLRQFVGPRLFSSNNFLEPVRSYALPISAALLAVLAAYVMALVFFWRRGRRISWGRVGWVEIALWCVGGALVYATPYLLMRPGVLERPIEVVYAEEALGLEGVRIDSEDEAFGDLRTFVGLPPGRVWLDDRYPLVHGPDPEVPLPVPVEDPPDIVLILIESMRAQCFEFIYPEAEGCEVPFLESLAREGVVFPRFIANGFPSSEGFIATTTSAWPHHRKRVIADYVASDFDALPERLAGMGYYTLAAEPNASFDKVAPWYDRFFEERVDLTELGLWNSEEELVEVVRERIEQHDKEHPDQPLYLQIKTVNPHLPYGTPRPDGTMHLEGETLLDHYRYTMGYVDGQLERLISWMKTRPRGDNLVVIVTGDHANYLDQKDTTALPFNHTAWVGAWIHGPQRWIGSPRRVESNASQVDLMPTVLAMVGDYRPSGAVGRDLLGPGRGGEGAAIMVRPGGLRMDRQDRALILDRKRPGVPMEYVAFPREAHEETDVVFGAEDLDRLWDSVMTFSFLIEENRLWNPAFLNEPANSPQ